MIQNGMSIENEDDLKFIERFSSDETKATLIELKRQFGEKPFENGKRYVIK
jgi:hypothetical protein